MSSFCLNHMTVPRMGFCDLVRTAAAIGCSGIEVRNDLGNVLFDGMPPKDAQGFAAEHGVQILAVAEVAAFNDGSGRALENVEELAQLAAECGALGVSLIPSLAEHDTPSIATQTVTANTLGNTAHSTNANIRASAAQASDATVLQLRKTLTDFAPILDNHAVLGFIEPLGFEAASLRLKADVVAAINEVGFQSRFRLVHDTFHHHVAAEHKLFPEHTGIVHVSGVINGAANGAVDKSLAVNELTDAHRGLVDANDTLNNLEQIQQLTLGGFTGPISIEAFSPLVHNLQDPQAALRTCFNHIGPSTKVNSA